MPFSTFVVLAEMRTGSNLLEANLNALPGVACHGEAFNPSFVGGPGREELLGVTLPAREADPLDLLARIAREPGLNGFRLFSDHDPRIVEAVLADPACAKVVLTRNPAESYVSRRIAAQTGQWRLTGAAQARTARIRFEAEGFSEHLDRLQAFQLRILRALQVTGQTAFWLDYEDLQDLEVLQGLARFLGAAPPDALDRRLKKQNPEPLAEKVVNFAEMEAALGPLDRFDLSRTPSFEPRRAAQVPQALLAARSPLLVLPIRSGPEGAMRRWLAALDGAPPVRGLGLKELRAWKAARPGHLSLTVLRHPLARAHAAFCERILGDGPGTLPEMRANLRRTFGLPVPAEGVPEALVREGGDGWDDAAHRAAFGRFLDFLRANLGGQTSMRVDAAWASQLALVQGFATVNPPDRILREAMLELDLAAVALALGRDAPELGETDAFAPRLARIRDAELEAQAAAAYARDMLAFGFGAWEGPRGA
jgi:LPS sulfotransferase NodH